MSLNEKILLTKILTTLLIVFLLSWIAEKINTKIAGILAGMPLGALLVFSFIGYELGSNFISESAIYAVPGILGTLGFSVSYYLVSKRELPMCVPLSILAGLFGYALIAFTLSQFSFTLFWGLIVSITGLVIVGRFFRHIANYNIKKPIKLTFGQIVFRAGLPALVVTSITECASLLGARWSGLLVGFPITFLPFLLIIHLSYSREYAHTLIKNLPTGLGSLLTFLATINLFSYYLGTFLSILIAFLSSLLYLLIFSFLVQFSKSKA